MNIATMILYLQDSSRIPTKQCCAALLIGARVELIVHRARVGVGIHFGRVSYQKDLRGLAPSSSLRFLRPAEQCYSRLKNEVYLQSGSIDRC